MKACKVTIQILFSEGNFHKNNQGLLVILKKLRHDFFLYVYGLFGEKKIKKSPSLFDSFPNPARFIARRDRREQRELLNSTYKDEKFLANKNK